MPADFDPALYEWAERSVREMLRRVLRAAALEAALAYDPRSWGL